MFGVIILAAVGMLAVVGGVVMTVQSRPLPGGVITTGTVRSIDVRRNRTGTASARRTMQTYAPVVEFADATGATHTVTSSVSGGVPPEIGSTLQVSYLPGNPNTARILNQAGATGARYLILVVGVAAIVAAVILAVR